MTFVSAIPLTDFSKQYRNDQKMRKQDNTLLALAFSPSRFWSFLVWLATNSGEVRQMQSLV